MVIAKKTSLELHRLNSSPDSLEKLIALGDLYAGKGDEVESHHYYQEAIEKYPQKAEGYLRLGDLSLTTSKYNDAENFYLIATEKDHNAISGWVGLARTFLRLDSNTQAEETINHALKLMPQDPEALFFAGDIYMQLHQYPNAIEILQKLILLSEDRFKPRAHFYLGLLFARQGFYLKSLDLLKKCIDFKEFQENSSANHIALLNNLALVQFHLGNYPEAEKIFVNLTDGDVPVSPVVWINLAQIYWIQDKVEESEKALTTANEMDLNSWPWMNELAFYRESGPKGLKELMVNLRQTSSKGQNIALYLGCIAPNRYPYVEAATRHFLDAFNIGVVDLEGASCCPAPGVFRSFDIETWLTLGARNIAIAEATGRDLITMCNGCYGTLNDVNTQLKENPQKKAKVNEHLAKINKNYRGSQRVRHVVDLIYNDIGLDVIKTKITRPLGLNIGVHYGCHILKPHGDKPWKSNSEDPHFLDDMVTLAGCKSIPYEDKLMCCGAGGAVRTGMKEVSVDFTREKLTNMRDAGVDAIVVCCPFCLLQLDLGQTEVNNLFKDQIGEPFQIPVIYITQLLGLAMGMDPYKLGFLKTPKVKGVPPYVPFESIFTQYLEMNL